MPISFEQVLRPLILPRPFSIDAFCDRLARARGRPIRLVPMPRGMATPCGLWLSTTQAHYVFHQVISSPVVASVLTPPDAHWLTPDGSSGNVPDEIRPVGFLEPLTVHLL